MIIVYITCKDKSEASKLSKSLLERKLVACTNFFPIQSMYWWQGKLQEDNEYVIIAKAVKENYENIKNLIKKIHSYETPCIISWNIDDVNKEYDDWLKSVLI